MVHIASGQTPVTLRPQQQAIFGPHRCQVYRNSTEVLQGNGFHVAVALHATEIETATNEWFVEFGNANGTGNTVSRRYTTATFNAANLNPVLLSFACDLGIETPFTAPAGVPDLFSTRWITGFVDNPQYATNDQPTFVEVTDEETATTSASSHFRAVLEIRFIATQKKTLPGQVTPPRVSLQAYNWSTGKFDELTADAISSQYQFGYFHSLARYIEANDPDYVFTDVNGLLGVNWRLQLQNGDGTVVYDEAGDIIDIWTTTNPSN